MPRRRVLAGLAALATAGVVAPARPSQAVERFAPLPPEMQPSAAADDNFSTFSHIQGVPVYYWRDGIRDSQLRKWYAATTMLAHANRWMNDLQNLSAQAGWSPVSYIVSGGFYVNRSGQHGEGTAMDLDVVVWSDGRRCAPLDGHHTGSRGIRRRYLAIDASLRRRFRYVLDGAYNADHHDHFHADLGGTPTGLLLHESRADTVFVQSVCNDFMGSGLAVDGAWGPLTQGEFRELKQRLKVSGNMQNDRDACRLMLNRITRHGLRNHAI